MSHAGRLASDCYSFEWRSISDQIQTLSLDAPLKCLVGAGCAPPGWIPCDVSGAVFLTREHLWMDFTHVPSLSLIPDGFFETIVFDPSTWRYLHLLPSVLHHWKRILIQGGTLFFEDGIASVSQGSGAYAFDNPCHVLVLEKRARAIYKAGSDESLGLAQGYEWIQDLRSQMISNYRLLFQDWACVEQVRDPVFATRSREWIRLTT